MEMNVRTMRREAVTISGDAGMYVPLKERQSLWMEMHICTMGREAYYRQSLQTERKVYNIGREAASIDGDEGRCRRN